MICGARYMENDGVFCQLEAGHTGEHFSYYRLETEPENSRRGYVSWKHEEDAVNRPGQRQPLPKETK